MVNWQVTATTIICNNTGEEVTIMVYKSGELKCTGEKSKSPGKSNHVLCSAATCPQIKSYHDKLMSEETRD